jgi:WD40 repeat protein
VIPANRSAQEQGLRRAFIPFLAQINPETNEPMRQVAKLDDLPADVHSLVERLVDARLLIRDKDAIEVAHESLLRQWPSLRNWLTEDLDKLFLRDAIRRAAAEWTKEGQREDLLVHRNGRLKDAEALLATPGYVVRAESDERAYLHACSAAQQAREAAEKAEQERRIQDAERIAEEQKKAAEAQKNIARRTTIGLALVALVAALAVGQYFKAVRATKVATSRQLAAQALVDLDVRAPHNLLLALESISITQQIGAFSPVTSRQLLDDVLNATGGMPLQHAAPVVAVGFSLDDRWLATASAGNVQLWDMQAPSATPIPLHGHDKVVNALTFSPDGRTLATVGNDAGVRLWDMAAADRTASGRVLAAHNGHLVDVAFSRSGWWLATASKDGAAELWDLAAADPATASSIMPHEHGVNTLAFSPDNHWLATGSSDGTVRLWDLLSPNPSAGSIPLHVNADVRKVAFSPNSQWLVAGDTENYTVVLMRVTAPDKPFLLKVNQWVGAVAFSPNGRWLATPSHYEARLWDLNKPDPSIEPLILPGHKYYITDLTFSPDGQWFATGSADHTVRLWNMVDRFTPPTVLRGHEGPISGLAFSHDGRHLATASVDQTVRLWNISSPAAEPLALRTPDSSTGLHMWDMQAVDLPAAPRILGGELDPGAGSVFSPDGQWLATIPSGENVDSVHLWNLSTPSPTHHVVRHKGGIWASPVYSPDGRWLATGGVRDPTIRLWDLKAPDPTRSPQVLRGHRGPVRSLAFSADGHRLVTGANDGLALVWDFTAVDPSASPRSLAGGGGTSIVHTVAISRDGRYVVTGSWEPDYAARIWDLSAPASSSSPITLTFKGRLDEVAFSLDGRWVAAGSWDFTTQLLDLTKPGAKPFVLLKHTARTLSVAFSPDSQWLATGNEDQTVRLWNLASADPSTNSAVLKAPYRVGNVSFSPDGHWLALNSTSYLSNSFSPDGHWFASSSTDTRLFHLRLEDLILLACRTAGRNLTQKEWAQSFGDQPHRATCPGLPLEEQAFR